MSDDQSERPTIPERYGVAIGQGSTRVTSRASAGDVVLAAAWQKHAVGALLLRLVAEYDSVRGELERAGKIARRAIDQARELLRKGETLKRAAALEARAPTRWLMEERAAEAIEAANAIQRRTPDEIRSARAFILIELQSLREAREHVATLAWMMSKRHGIDGVAAVRLSGRVLETYLDPICHFCDGVGRTGSGYLGEIGKVCRHCLSVGQRRDVIGNSPAETTFSAVLFGELQRRAASAARGISLALRDGEDPRSAADWPELRDRLNALRSVEAEADDWIEAVVVANVDDSDGVSFPAEELRPLHDGRRVFWDEASQTLTFRGEVQALDRMRSVGTQT